MSTIFLVYLEPETFKYSIPALTYKAKTTINTAKTERQFEDLAGRENIAKFLLYIQKFYYRLKLFNLVHIFSTFILFYPINS